MAGSSFQEIFCWEISVRNHLHIYLASTKKGTCHIGLTLKRRCNCTEYYAEIFPSARVAMDYQLNRELVAQVESEFQNQVSKHTMDLEFDVPCTPFQWSVWWVLRSIPFGETRSYAEVASMLGKPGASRAVGQALKRNPLPIIFPCHRVVAAKGLGGFSCGLDIKEYLLDYEKSGLASSGF